MSDLIESAARAGKACAALLRFRSEYGCCAAGRAQASPAAVLVLLTPDGRVILTSERSQQIPSRPDIFPGGKQDEGDASLGPVPFVRRREIGLNAAHVNTSAPCRSMRR